MSAMAILQQSKESLSIFDQSGAQTPNGTAGMPATA